MREFGPPPSAVPVRTIDTIASKFEALDVHDDTLEGISFHPAIKRGTKAKVTVELFRRWTNTRRVLTFGGCANVEFVVDSDVLVDNSPNNTDGTDASAEIPRIQALMKRHKRSWNVAYQTSINPLKAKLSKAGDLTLFRVRFFGGTLAVLASSFSIKRDVQARPSVEKR